MKTDTQRMARILEEDMLVTYKDEVRYMYS